MASPTGREGDKPLGHQSRVESFRNSQKKRQNIKLFSRGNKGNLEVGHRSGKVRDFYELRPADVVKNVEVSL